MGCLQSRSAIESPEEIRRSIRMSSVRRDSLRPSEIILEDGNVIDTKNLTPELLADLSDEEVAAIELGKTRFFRRIKQVVKDQDYAIVVDRSASMKGSRWSSAEEAVKLIAEAVCSFDKDGISLYFFSSKYNDDVKPFTKYSNVKTAEEVVNLFSKPENNPKGGTDITSVLSDALKPDNLLSSGHRKPKSVLVITDGSPENVKSTELLLISTANEVASADELSVTIVQIGDDAKATEWLSHLDEGLANPSKAKWGAVADKDIVDIVSTATLKSADFLASLRKTVLN